MRLSHDPRRGQRAHLPMASRGRRMRPALERRAQVLVADATALVSPVVISLLAIERHRVAGYGRQHPGPQGEGPLVRTYAFAHNPPSLSVASQAWPSGSAAALSLSTRHAAWRLAEASSDRLASGQPARARRHWTDRSGDRRRQRAPRQLVSIATSVLAHSRRRMDVAEVCRGLFFVRS